MSQFEVSEALKEKLYKAETLDEVLLACSEERDEITKGGLETAAAISGQLTESDLANVAGECVALAIAATIVIYTYWKYPRRR